MAPQMPPALLHAAAAAQEALASLLWFGAAALVPAEALQVVTPITGPPGHSLVRPRSDFQQCQGADDRPTRRKAP